MIRLLFWMAGCAALWYVVWRFGYWHQFAAVTVVYAACLWTLGGAFLLTRQVRRGNPAAGAGVAEGSAFRAAAERAEMERRMREGGQ